ncbi:MAG TPA: carboxypeptidase regulatory-like domain-containing protein, partial [Kofleriaceae bacterium]
AHVVTMLVRTRRRGETRRDAREQRFDDARVTPTPAELVERVELQRAVAHEVLALDEPYRSTVLLHFFEGVSSVELARRLGISASTVRGRLKVALEQLRTALERRADPPKRGWLAALVPLVNVPTSRAPIVIGVLAVKKLIAIVALVIVVLAVRIAWKRHRDRPAPSAPVAHAATTPFGINRPEANRSIPSWLVQSGVAPRRIAGRVVAAGAPVGNATVRLGLHTGDTLLQPIAEVSTAADGAFDFGPQPASFFTISASADHHAPRSIAVALADPAAKTDQLVIELGDCRSRVFGIVHDAGGGPIAHAHITSSGLSGVDSDANGHFELCLVQEIAPGIPSTNVRVEADGYGTREERIVVGGELHHDFVLAPEAVLIGRVMIGDRPVASARVTATPDAMDRVHLVAGNWADSDADGRFRIAALAPARFQLTASADHLGSAKPTLVIARPASTSREIRLALTAFARVRGRVMRDGAPVAGAAVDVDGGHAASMSQADGSFVLDQVPYGAVKLVAPPYRVVDPKLLAVAADLDGVELDVAKLATLRGHVTRKSKPARDASITCTDETGTHTATTADDGSYVLDGLGKAVTCLVWAGDGTFAEPGRKELSSTDDNELDFDLAYDGSVNGTVVDEAGKPVAGAYIVMEFAGDACETVSDANGAYDCGKLTGGDYSVTVTPSAGSRVPFAAATGARLAAIHVTSDGAVSGVTLAIKNERRSIRGTVVDDTGAPVADVHVEVVANGSSSMALPSTLSDVAGRFEIFDLAPGTYSVHAHAADGSETEVTGIASGTDNVAITLARPGTIDGTLVGFSSPPAITASTLTSDLNLVGIGTVDGNTFVVGGLTPGHYTIQAQAGAEVDGQVVDVHSNETAHVTLTSRGVGTVTGRVTEYTDHAPVTGMRCDGNISAGGLMPNVPPDETRQAFTDANGHFTVAAPLGAVRVFCFRMGGPMGGPPISAAGIDVQVSSDSVPNVELVAVPSTFGGTPGNVGFNLSPMQLPLTINRVDPSGPAAANGIVVGDELITIDGISVQGMLPDGAMTALMNHRPGSVASLGILHGTVGRTVQLTVGD